MFFEIENGFVVSWSVFFLMYFYVKILIFNFQTGAQLSGRRRL